ncbi:MAG: 50S ribosomal protein L9 [bacterium]|nr:50S ribosomal protein L9 [bacterium]
MRVLLLQDVKKVGRKHDIKEVSDGYARNFLLARKLAVPADATALKIKASAEKKEQELLAKYSAEVVRLKSEVLEFPVRSGSKGEVFGSVTVADIKKALEAKGFSDCEVELEQSLRFLGEREVEVVFGKGIRGKVKVKLLTQS